MGTTSRAGVDEDLRLYQSLDQFWHPVIRDADLTDSPELVVLLERRLVIARLNNEIVAFDDRCVHRGASMALGAIEDGCLRCAYHGWLYDNDGVSTIPEFFERLDKLLLVARMQANRGFIEDIQDAGQSCA